MFSKLEVSLRVTLQLLKVIETNMSFIKELGRIMNNREVDKLVEMHTSNNTRIVNEAYDVVEKITENSVPMSK